MGHNAHLEFLCVFEITKATLYNCFHIISLAGVGRKLNEMRFHNSMLTLLCLGKVLELCTFTLEERYRSAVREKDTNKW